MSTPETPYTRGEMYLSAIADGDSSGIPDRPYTRKEKYLDAIATGDSSGIPETPYTREEMYLDAIAKNGGGGGGGSSWELLASAEYTVNTTSTSIQLVGTIDLDADLTENDIVFIHIRDKAGKRNGYFYGSDTIAFTYKNSTLTQVTTLPWWVIVCNSSGDYSAINNAYGIYGSSYNPNTKKINISSRYNSSFSMTINGTYKVKVYKLTTAPGMVLYE